MSKGGSYTVNAGRPKDTSFRSFICALLVFLAICGLIYLALAFLTNRKESEGTGAFKEPDVESEKEKLSVVKAQGKEKEKEYFTTQKPETPFTVLNNTKQSFLDNEQTETSTDVLVSLKDTTIDFGIDSPLFHGSTEQNGTQDPKPTDESTGEEEESDFNTISTTTKPLSNNSAETTTESVSTVNTENIALTSSTSKPWFLTTGLNTTQTGGAYSNNDDNATEGDTKGETTDDSDGTSTPNSFTNPYTKLLTNNYTDTTDYHVQRTVSLFVAASVDSTTNGAQTENAPKEYVTEKTAPTDVDEATSTPLITSDSGKSEWVDPYIGTATEGYSTVKAVEVNETDSTTEGDKNISTPIFTPRTNSSFTTTGSDEQFLTGDTPLLTTTDAMIVEAYAEKSTGGVGTTVGVTEMDTTTMVITTTRRLPQIITTAATRGTTTTKRAIVESEYTRISKQVTSTMLTMMNHAANPCENFYEFVCGGQKTDEDAFKEENLEALLNYVRNISNSSEKYLQDFQMFYSSCVIHESSFNISQRMENVLNLPHRSFTELITELILTQSMPLFDVGLDIDKNSLYKFQLTLPRMSSFKTSVNGWSLDEQIREECLNKYSHTGSGIDVNLDNIYKAVQNCHSSRLKDVALHFIDNMNYLKPENNLFNESDVLEMLNLLERVKLMMPKEQLIHFDSINRKYRKVSIQDLNKICNYIDWKEVLESITFNHTINENDTVDVYFPNHMEKMLKFFQTYKELLIYFVDPFLSRPVSFYPSDYIVFHPAVYQRTSMSLLEYLKLSKVGLHLSTALARHVDPTGRRYLTGDLVASSDNYYSFLTNQTSNLFRHYAGGSYTVGRRNFSFNAEPSFFANEMIADNAAMRLVYDSFMNLPDQEVLPGIFGFYSAKQAFFITAAQEYCSRSTPIDFMENLYINNQLPSSIKIQNIVSNCLEFTDAFACEPGSGMTLLDSSMITQFPYIPYNDEDYSYKFFIYS